MTNDKVVRLMEKAAAMGANTPKQRRILRRAFRLAASYWGSPERSDSVDYSDIIEIYRKTARKLY